MWLACRRSQPKANEVHHSAARVACGQRRLINTQRGVRVTAAAPLLLRQLSKFVAATYEPTIVLIPTHLLHHLLPPIHTRTYKWMEWKYPVSVLHLWFAKFVLLACEDSLVNLLLCLHSLWTLLAKPSLLVCGEFFCGAATLRHLPVVVL